MWKTLDFARFSMTLSFPNNDESNALKSRKVCKGTGFCWASLPSCYPLSCSAKSLPIYPCFVFFFALSPFLFYTSARSSFTFSLAPSFATTTEGRRGCTLDQTKRSTVGLRAVTSAYQTLSIFALTLQLQPQTFIQTSIQLVNNKNRKTIFQRKQNWKNLILK